jgi:hypothetical protein
LATTPEGYNPIFLIEPDTEARQMWFVGCKNRDIMGMLYKDEEGWVLRYRFRNYARPISDHWDDQTSIKDSAFDSEDTKRVFNIRPAAGMTVDEAALTKLALEFTTLMEQLCEIMQNEEDPSAYLWTQRVTTGNDIFKVLQTAPWAHSKTIKRPETAHD